MEDTHLFSLVKEKKQKYVQDRKELRKVDWYIFESIISVLHEHGRINNTKITSICGMNYGSLVKYLTRLESLRLVTCSTEGRFKFAALTPRGIEYFKSEIAHKKVPLYA